MPFGMGLRNCIGELSFQVKAFKHWYESNKRSDRTVTVLYADVTYL